MAKIVLEAVQELPFKIALQAAREIILFGANANARELISQKQMANIPVADQIRPLM